MTRAVQHITLGTLLASVYLACFLGYVPFSSKIQDEIIPYLPFWALISFGAFLLFKLGYGIVTFNDIPGAYESLMAEIDEAKKDLRAKGVTID